MYSRHAAMVTDYYQLIREEKQMIMKASSQKYLVTFKNRLIDCITSSEQHQTNLGGLFGALLEGTAGVTVTSCQQLSLDT